MTEPRARWISDKLLLLNRRKFGWLHADLEECVCVCEIVGRAFFSTQCYRKNALCVFDRFYKAGQEFANVIVGKQKFAFTQLYCGRGCLCSRRVLLKFDWQTKTDVSSELKRTESL